MIESETVGAEETVLLGGNLLWYHFIYHKSNIIRPAIGHWLPQWEAATNSLSCGTAHLTLVSLHQLCTHSERGLVSVGIYRTL
jgi:hypothetical protein